MYQRLLSEKLNGLKATKPLGDLSPMYDRMGMELAIGLNTWLTEYDVTLVL